jgi:hypothetical protein
MTLVYYYVPEDQDDPEYPNVFGVMVGKEHIRLNHIIDNFPLNGTYLFRFKAVYDNVTVWLDFNDLNMKVPMLKNKVYVKATRISWESENSLNYLR